MKCFSSPHKLLVALSLIGFIQVWLSSDSSARKHGRESRPLELHGDEFKNKIKYMHVNTHTHSLFFFQSRSRVSSYSLRKRRRCELSFTEADLCKKTQTTATQLMNISLMCNRTLPRTTSSSFVGVCVFLSQPKGWLDVTVLNLEEGESSASTAVKVGVVVGGGVGCVCIRVVF